MLYSISKGSVLYSKRVQQGPHSIYKFIWIHESDLHKFAAGKTILEAENTNQQLTNVLEHGNQTGIVKQS